MEWKEFVELFRKEFVKALNKKTSWGRRELEALVDRVCAFVLAQILDKEMQKAKCKSKNLKKEDAHLTNSRAWTD